MKKVIAVLLLIICTAVLFAATTYTQTIVLMSVVEQTKPRFGLEIAYIENGYAVNSGNEVIIHSIDIRENTYVGINVCQSFSRFKGEVEIKISVSELCCEKYHTEGLKLSVNSLDTGGRKRQVSIYENICILDLNYTGKAITDSIVADILIEYNGNQNLPKKDYVSYIKVSYEAK